MPIWLKQSTASQEVLLGPFLDDTDGKTAETGLTIANTDIKIWKTGATTEASKNSGGATHIAAGRYYAVLDATGTDTLGPMEINVHVSGALPVRRECLVLSAVIYDSLVAGSDVLQTDVTQLNGSSTAAQNLARSASAIYRGSVTGSATTTTLIDSALTQSDTDHWKGRVLIFTTGSLAFQATDITAFTPGTDQLTFTALTNAPSGGNEYVIV